MRLYEQFLKINPRHYSNRQEFIKNNCPTAKLIEDLNRRGLYSFVENPYIQDKCSKCDLCKKRVFIDSRKLIKDTLKELKSSWIIYLPGKLESISEEYLNLRMLILETTDDSYEMGLDFSNLRQMIIYDVLEDFMERLNSLGTDNKYFSQIVQILLSTKDFISDINRIREEYLEDQTGKESGYDFYRKPDIRRSDIYKEIVKIRKKYLLAQRWESWIEEILYYDFNKNKKIIYRSLPSGRILKNIKPVHENGQIKVIKESAVVEDETKREMEDFNHIYGSNINLAQAMKKKRRPILEFEKQLRWYNMRGEGISYIDIFDRELDNYFQDWKEFEEYKRVRDDDSVRVLSNNRTKGQIEQMVINRIKTGVNKLRQRVYKQLK